MKKTMLIILDGYGYREAPEGNAVYTAKTPVFDRLWNEFPHTLIEASGTPVGLPDGQMGNSEVGHLNLGAGRVVYQNFTRINLAIQNGDFFKNSVFLEAVDHANANESNLHLIGLVSDGGVHSHVDHIFALLELARQKEIKDVFLHAIMDGRDTSPTAGIEYLRMCQDKMNQLGTGKISTICGRYWAMDRDRRWPRIERAYRAMVHGEGIEADNPKKAIQTSYDNDVTDEFIEPIVISQNGKPVGMIGDNDTIIFFNFRADRGRQLTLTLTDPNFNDFETKQMALHYMTMTQYDESYDLPIAFKPQAMDQILGEVIANLNLKQLRIAETEKYAHVTYFFNGGLENPFDGEDRILIPSPKVATYDLQPEMNAIEVTENVIKAIKSEKYNFILLNYANPDMVGHTGVFDAAVKACEITDWGLSRIVPELQKRGTACIITADHGNADVMWDKNGKVHTAHTTNPTPLVIVDDELIKPLKEDGKLADIAPTLLELMGIPQPEEMTGKSLIAE